MGIHWRVRPTLRVLAEDLGIHLPTVDTPLTDLQHPLVKRAQLVPDAVASGGAKRIVSLKDRVWFKAKTGRYRGGVTHHQFEQTDADSEWLSGWWLGFGGVREDGSSADVYAEILARSAANKAAATKGVDTGWLMPTARDGLRHRAEFAAREERAMRDQVLATIVESAVTGKTLSTLYRHHVLTVQVRVPDNLTYIAVGVTGLGNPREIAALLACVPGVDPGEWGIEPGPVLEITPHPGQLVYSTALDTAVLADLIESYPPGTLEIAD